MSFVLKMNGQIKPKILVGFCHKKILNFVTASEPTPRDQAGKRLMFSRGKKDFLCNHSDYPGDRS